MKRKVRSLIEKLKHEPGKGFVVMTFETILYSLEFLEEDLALVKATRKRLDGLTEEFDERSQHLTVMIKRVIGTLDIWSTGVQSQLIKPKKVQSHSP